MDESPQLQIFSLEREGVVPGLHGILQPHNFGTHVILQRRMGLAGMDARLSGHGVSSTRHRNIGTSPQPRNDLMGLPQFIHRNGSVRGNLIRYGGNELWVMILILVLNLVPFSSLLSPLLLFLDGDLVKRQSGFAPR